MYQQDEEGKAAEILCKLRSNMSEQDQSAENLASRFPQGQDACQYVPTFVPPQYNPYNQEYLQYLSLCHLYCPPPNPPLSALYPLQQELYSRQLLEMPDMEKTRTRRTRTKYPETQRKVLEKKFEKTRYPTAKEKKELSDNLELSICKVSTWFQNRRAKWRRKLSSDKKANKKLSSLDEEFKELS